MPCACSMWTGVIHQLAAVVRSAPGSPSTRGCHHVNRGRQVRPAGLTAAECDCQVGAAVLGVAVKPTIKEVDGGGSVVRTLQRSRLVEVQTPQVTHRSFVCHTPLIRHRALAARSVNMVGTLSDSIQVAEILVHALLQVIRPDLLTAGFKLVQEQSLEVTDDVSIIEALGKPVKITYGSYSNIKASMLVPLVLL